MPATPAANATRIVVVLTCVCATENSFRLKPSGSRSKRSRNEAHDAGEQPGGGEPDRQATSPRRTSLGRRSTSPVHAAVTGRRSGLIAMAPTISVALSLTTASAGDDARGGHQHEVARGRARLDLRLPEHVGPDQGRGLAAAGSERDRVEPDERDVARRHTQRLERRKRRVGGLGANVRRDERRPVGARLDQAHVARAGQRVEPLRDGGHQRGLSVDAKLEHAVRVRRDGLGSC